MAKICFVNSDHETIVICDFPVYYHRMLEDLNDSYLHDLDSKWAGRIWDYAYQGFLGWLVRYYCDNTPLNGESYDDITVEQISFMDNADYDSNSHAAVYMIMHPEE